MVAGPMPRGCDINYQPIKTCLAARCWIIARTSMSTASNYFADPEMKRPMKRGTAGEGGEGWGRVLGWRDRWEITANHQSSNGGEWPMFPSGPSSPRPTVFSSKSSRCNQTWMLSKTRGRRRILHKSASSELKKKLHSASSENKHSARWFYDLRVKFRRWYLHAHQRAPGDRRRYRMSRLRCSGGWGIETLSPSIIHGSWNNKLYANW